MLIWFYKSRRVEEVILYTDINNLSNKLNNFEDQYLIYEKTENQFPANEKNLI